MRWRHHSSLAIERVIPHPTEEQVTVMEHLAPSVVGDASTTRVLVFQASSSTPTSIRTLPFQLRSVVPVPSFFPTDPSQFTLVGITTSWSVVVFGDDVQLPEEEGVSAQGITQGATVEKRSLFHDIFGASAFADLATVPGPSTLGTSIAQRWKGKDTADIFDVPAHLMPPLETLFDTIMDGFLAMRPQGEEGQEEDAGADEEMDVGEAVDGADRPPKSAPLDRVVDRQEMGVFVELFIHHAIKGTSWPCPLSLARRLTWLSCSAPSSRSMSQVSRVHKLNGIPPHISGVHATPKGTSKSNGVLPNGHADSPSQLPPAEDSSPAKAGRKRKKSLG